MAKSLATKEAKAGKIVNAIIKDLTSRRGLRQEWDEFDEDIKTEIREEWENIVNRILTK